MSVRSTRLPEPPACSLITRKRDPCPCRRRLGEVSVVGGPARDKQAANSSQNHIWVPRSSPLLARAGTATPILQSRPAGRHKKAHRFSGSNQLPEVSGSERSPLAKC